jgi:hypothetical protein
LLPVPFRFQLSIPLSSTFNWNVEPRRPIDREWWSDQTKDVIIIIQFFKASFLLHGTRCPYAHNKWMIQYLGKNNFKHKSLELGSKGRKSGGERGRAFQILGVQEEKARSPHRSFLAGGTTSFSLSVSDRRPESFDLWRLTSWAR